MFNAYLMPNALFNLSYVVDLVSKSDMKIYLKITKVFQSILTSISIEITSIFKYILSEYVLLLIKKQKLPSSLNIPQKVSEARSINLEGKYAVVTNFPYLEINDINEHSYVNIDEIVIHYLYSSGQYLEVPDISFYEKG